MRIETPMTELLGIKYPIVQGGLAHLAFAGLCAAVSNAGGLGQISAATIPGGIDALRGEIRNVRETDRPAICRQLRHQRASRHHAHGRTGT